MGKLFLTIIVLFSLGYSSENVKTQEQVIEETVAYSLGSALRHQKQDKEQCNKQFKDAQAKACINGYEKADEALRKPAK
ncbi:MAG: hypothetical protein PHQ70_08400 [Arcobacter sp.]|uniref:hypothetical protein n=1 Tax=Arcobacter sp. TaxID=1872629 RepID=UPI0025867074|nr:hypothetical protein [Arcobacter sp.]MDD3008872.1 hypothetical protein [Arcobacter sp.]